MTTIETDRLSYRPGRGFRLENLTIRVPEGAVYGFLGPNGAGKTTTIRLLLGLLRPEGGTIRVLGHPVPSASWRALADVGYVPEAPHLYGSLTVDQALYYHAGFYPRWDDERADQLVQRFRLRRAQRLRSLSKGELRKLMILLAFVPRPRLLMLDEPTDGLDPVVRRDILDALGQVVAEGETTVFLSSHLVHELEEICDWIAVLDRGSLVAQAPMTAFRDGIKRLRCRPPPDASPPPPFHILRRIQGASPAATEEWIVRDWNATSPEYFAEPGAELHTVEDIDLENGFVELLRSFRDRSEGDA